MKVKIKDAFNLQMGKTPNRNNFLYWENGAEDWISIADMSKCGMYINCTKEKITNIAVEESKIKSIPENTVIMSFKLSIGKVAITSKKMYSNEAIMAFLDKQVVEIEPEYLYYLLMSQKWESGANKAVLGKTLNKNTISQIEIDIHEFVQQKKIVKILNCVSAIINQYKEQLIKLDQLISSRFVEMFGDPVTNTKHWQMVHIEDVVSEEKNALKAGPFGSALKKEFYVDAGYKIYGQEQVISGDAHYGNYYIDEEKYESLKNCAVRAGDVLISLVGTYGKLLIIPDDFEPGIINPRLMKITFDKKKIKPIYFKYFFQSDALKASLAENTHGGTMDILNLGIVRKIAIPLPSIELQNQFAAFVDQIDKSKLVVQKALDETQLLFDSLMQKYFG